VYTTFPASSRNIMRYMSPDTRPGKGAPSEVRPAIARPARDELRSRKQALRISGRDIACALERLRAVQRPACLVRVY
jgi:hypothetical protein